MNNSELFMQEFDKLPKDEQFRLGVSGLFQMVQDDSRRLVSGSQASRGYGSLLGQRSGSDSLDDMHLHKDTVRDMASSITSKIQKVKITDVLTDVIQPMEDVLRRISFDNRLHKNRLHHENTLYYQGIINAVDNIGKHSNNTIFRNMYLKWQGFMRHPVWNSFLMLNDYVIKPLGRLGARLLFGKRDDPVQKKILNAIKNQTEFFTKGSITQPGFFKRLISQGVMGFAFNEAASGFKTVLNSMGILKSDNRKGFDEQQVERLDTLINVNEEIDSKISNSDRKSNTLLEHMLARISVMPEAIGHSMMSRLLPSPYVKLSEDQYRLAVEKAKQEKEYRENSLVAQQDAADELEDHNKRERRRTLLSGLGGLLRFLGGGGVLLGIIGGALSLLNDTVRESIWSGFKTVAGALGSWIYDKIGFGGVTALGLGAAVASGLISAGLATKAGLVVGSLMGVHTLNEFLSGWARNRQGGSSVAELMEEATTQAIAQGFGSRTPYQMNTSFFTTDERYIASLERQIESTEEAIEEERRNRVGYGRNETLINLNSQLERLNEQLRSGRLEGQISPIALSSALMVSGETSASVRSPRRNRSTNSIIDDPMFEEFKQRLIQQESGGRQNVTSWRGATGVMQLMPDTARDVANRLGVDFDLDRLRNDRSYNEMLGTQYLRERLEMFDGDPVLAAFAYNAGAGATRRLISRYGDPRTGEISHGEWLNAIENNHSGDINSWGKQSVPYARNVGLPMLDGHEGGGSRTQRFMDNTRSFTNNSMGKLEDAIGAIIGIPSGAAGEEGILSNLSSVFGGSGDSPSEPETRTVRIEPSQFRQLLANLVTQNEDTGEIVLNTDYLLGD